jgi:peptidylprolyl isomerase
MVGLQVNIDGAIGVVRTVSGGRTVVDFNHPLAGKDISYKVNVIRKITDDKEKIKSLVGLALNQKNDSMLITIHEGKAKISIKKNFPEEFLKLLKERITKILTHIKEVEFAVETIVEKKEAN